MTHAGQHQIWSKSHLAQKNQKNKTYKIVSCQPIRVSPGTKKTQKNKTLKIISQSPVYYNLTWYQKKTSRIKLIKCCPNLLSIRGEDTKDTKDTKTNEEENL